MREQIKEAEANAADVIRRGCGASVSVCCRDGSNWTIHGEKSNVEKAVAYLVRIRFCRFESQHVSEDDGEVFAYVKVIDV